jgi:hypothetical protein
MLLHGELANVAWPIVRVWEYSFVPLSTVFILKSGIWGVGLKVRN